MPKIITDEELQRAVDWYEACGRSVRAAARESGIPRNTVAYHIDKAFERGMKPSGEDPRLDRMSVQQVAQCEKRGIPSTQLSHGWDKDAETGRSYFFKVPKPGENPDDLADVLRHALGSAQRAKPRKLKVSKAARDFNAKLPIFDAHLGMISEASRTGVDWDTEKAAHRLVDGSAKLIDSCPESGGITIVFGGDTTHQDDKLNRTPASKHTLDGDHYHKVIFTTVKAARDVINYALGKFSQVRVKVLRGNHDENAHVALTVALSAYFDDEPRVSVDVSFDDFYQQRFGKCFDLYHHGDKGDPTKLVLKAADQWAEDWARTRHRNVWTGHIHHDASKDIGGMKWHSMRTMAPQDFYGHSAGYVSRQTLRLMLDDREHGEVQSFTVNF